MLIKNINKQYRDFLQNNDSLILHSFSHLYYKNNHPNYLTSSNLIKNKKHEIFIIKFFRYISFFFIFDNLKSNLKNNSTKKILVLSHRLKSKNNIDIYFEELKNKLNNKDYISININHTGTKSKNLKPDNNEIILSTRLPIFKELFIICKILLTFIRYPKVLIYQKSISDYSRIMNQSLYNLRIYYQVEQCIKKFKPQYIYFTYEGYSYERLVCFLCNRNKIKSVGYQSSVILESTYSIFQSYGVNYNPDIVYTKNKFNFNLLKKKNKIKKVKLLNIGTDYKTRFKNKNLKFKKKITVLVIPEGIYSECYNLFKFSLQYALRNKDISFIWRIHPLFNWGDVKKYLGISQYPKNIIFSKNNLNSDILKSSFCLYRSSGTVFKCINNNLIPIYLKLKEDISTLDPLFQYNNNIVTNTENFSSLIKKFNKNVTKRKELSKYNKFKKDFFQKIDTQKILRII